MAKPKMFIGSSVEGLDIAEALQLNLQRVAEVSVWHQGIFKPSTSGLDSLMTTLATQDFGTFIFTPDDVLSMRGSAVEAARDNVIFELGLYVGGLGLKRSFFVVPDTGSLHLPTDLAGITPLKYETGRSDGNWRSALAGVSYEIVQAIKLSGSKRRTTLAASEGPDLPQQQETESIQSQVMPAQESQVQTPAVEPSTIEGKLSWFEDFQEGRFAEAIATIDRQIAIAAATEIVSLKCFRAWATYGMDPGLGEEEFAKLIQEYPLDSEPRDYFVSAMIKGGRVEEALAISIEALHVFPDAVSAIQSHAFALEKLGKQDEAVSFLISAIKRLPSEGDLYAQLSKLLIKSKEVERARFWLDRGMQLTGQNTAVVRAYASLLNEKEGPKAALVAYMEWVRREKAAEPLALRANAYLALNFSGLALRDYRRADELAKNEEAWIVSNIGNLLSSVGLHDEAISYLNKALELDPKSQYAHERLATAIKAKDEEVVALNLALDEARAALQQWRVSNPADPNPSRREVL